MADRSLKSTIQVDMDTSGVVKGVAATNRELEKMNRTAARTASATSITAALGVAQTAFSVLQQIVGMMDARAKELTDIAFKYSPEAMAAKAQLTAGTFRAEQQIAEAVGPGAAAAAREQLFRKEQEAARLTADPNAAANVAATASFMETMRSGATAFVDTFSSQFSQGDFLGTLTGAGIIKNAMDAFGLTGVLTGGEVAQQATEARGMAYDPAKQAAVDQGFFERMTKSLESMDRKLGGT